MHLSEEQLKDILRHAQIQFEADLQLEDTIMTEINEIQFDQGAIQRSKRKAKIGIRISFAAAVCLTLSLAYNVVYSPFHQEIGLKKMLPSFMVIMMLLTLNQLLYFSSKLRKGVRI